MSEPRIERTGERSVSVTFPADWPVFVGHLPGRPMVPGAELMRIAAEQMGGRMTGAKRFKFHRVVKPGDTVEMSWSDVGQVTVTAAGEPVCGGQIITER